MFYIFIKKNSVFAYAMKHILLIVLMLPLCFHSISGKAALTFPKKVCTSALDSTKTLSHKQLKTLWFVGRLKLLLIRIHILSFS